MGEADDERLPYLASATFVDSDHPAVIAYAQAAIGDAKTDVDKAARLFRTVRDGLRYDPYSVSNDPDDYRASAIATKERGYCVPKAILLCAALRAVGIPTKLGFADVKNHISTDKLRRAMGNDLFVFHGYAEMLVDGRWFKVTPAFNRGLCERFGVAPLEFDGTADALLQPFDGQGQRYMEYVRDRGTYVDLPFEDMLRAFVEAYGSEKATVPTHDDAFHG